MMQQTSLDPTTISQHEVLRLHECDTISDQVIALRERWTQRGEGKDFFTLGAATYLDAPGRRAAYLTAANDTNLLLRKTFAGLYDRVRRGFEDLLGRPVLYDSECPLPGFHIFEFYGADQSNDKPSSRAHFDLQWMHTMAGSSPDETLSFTLLIEEPLGGASLEIWPAMCSHLLLGFDALKYAASHPSQTLRYRRGHMLVHNGLLLHAIGLASVPRPKGRRITFQGHGVRIAQGWKLYW
jgi:hypothetical protein